MTLFSKSVLIEEAENSDFSLVTKRMSKSSEPALIDAHTGEVAV